MTTDLATAPTTEPAIADLLLVRMALPNPTPKKVRDDIGKLLNAELSATEFDGLRSELVSAGFLTKGKRNTFTITDAGRERVLQFLGASELPKRTNWSTVTARLLFPKAAGLAAEQAAKLDNGDKLAAFVVRRKYGLPASAGATVNQVLEALACKELGFPEVTTLADLLRVALSRLVGSDERLSKKVLQTQVPMFETGLVAITAEAVRRKLVRDWLGISVKTPQPAEPFDLAAFAATVRALAESSAPEDRFHDNKVFVAALWRASQREPAFQRLTLPEFKQRLVESNSQSLLHLSRADMPQAMNQQLVAESETKHENATFHFVLLEEARR